MIDETIDRRVHIAFDIFAEANLCKVRMSEGFAGEKTRTIYDMDSKIADCRFSNGILCIPNDKDIDFDYCDVEKYFFVTERFWNEDESEVTSYKDLIKTKSYIRALKCYLRALGILDKNNIKNKKGHENEK